MRRRARQHELESGCGAVKNILRVGRVLLGVLVLLGLALAIAAPHQRPLEHRRAVLDSDPRMDALFQRACANCHTNETAWPWYGRVGPGAWLIERDVARARAKLNFSIQSPLLATERQEVLDAVGDGAMPPKLYRFMHPEAKLTPEEMKALAAWVSKDR